MDDTLIYEETFETQFLDLPGETQVMDSDDEAEDLVEETQVMDFDSEAQFADTGGETQVLDDVNCTEHMGTQPLDATDSDNVSDADSEVSDSTKVLSDNDDIAKKSCDQLGDTQKVRCSSASEDSDKGSMEQPDALSDKKKNSGQAFTNHFKNFYKSSSCSGTIQMFYFINFSLCARIPWEEYV